MLFDFKLEQKFIPPHEYIERSIAFQYNGEVYFFGGGHYWESSSNSGRKTELDIFKRFFKINLQTGVIKELTYPLFDTFMSSINTGVVIVDEYAYFSGCYYNNGNSSNYSLSRQLLYRYDIIKDAWEDITYLCGRNYYYYNKPILVDREIYFFGQTYKPTLNGSIYHTSICDAWNVDTKRLRTLDQQCMLVNCPKIPYADNKKILLYSNSTVPDQNYAQIFNIDTGSFDPSFKMAIPKLSDNSHYLNNLRYLNDKLLYMNGTNLEYGYLDIINNINYPNIGKMDKSIFGYFRYNTYDHAPIFAHSMLSDDMYYGDRQLMITRDSSEDGSYNIVSLGQNIFNTGVVSYIEDMVSYEVLKNIHSIKVFADIPEKTFLSIIISKDDGVTWYSYKNGSWILVNKNEIIENGMSVNEIESISPTVFSSFITLGSKLKILTGLLTKTPHNTPKLKNIKIVYV